MKINPSFFTKPTVLTYLLLCMTFTSFAQIPNDCQNAVTVCGNSSFSLDVNGIGTRVK